jgi:hypothetical protein
MDGQMVEWMDDGRMMDRGGWKVDGEKKSKQRMDTWMVREWILNSRDLIFSN